jgi:hypothetical protein
MKITSQAFTDGGKIPDEYTKYGKNRIPPLHIEDIPDYARSIAVVVDDPDAPGGTFNHWILFNLSPSTTDIKENCVPVMATQGKNDFGDISYDGPKPPSGEHRYYFKAYALDMMLPVTRGVTRKQLEPELRQHALECATLMGRYAH